MSVDLLSARSTPMQTSQRSSIRLPRSRHVAVAIVVLGALANAPSHAQEVADAGFKSVGRGAPLAVALHAPSREAVPAGTTLAEMQRVRAEMQNYPFVGAM